MVRALYIRFAWAEVLLVVAACGNTKTSSPDDASLSMARTQDASLRRGVGDAEQGSRGGHSADGGSAQESIDAAPAAGTAPKKVRRSDQRRVRSRTVRPPRVRLGKATVTGELDSNLIRLRMHRKVPRIQHCYEKQLLVHPSLKAGIVSTRFEIDSSGKVQSASAKGISKQVSDCVVGVIRSIRFPKPKGGGVVLVLYPIKFSR